MNTKTGMSGEREKEEEDSVRASGSGMGWRGRGYDNKRTPALRRKRVEVCGGRGEGERGVCNSRRTPVLAGRSDVTGRGHNSLRLHR